jgi:hypothetical protein
MSLLLPFRSPADVRVDVAADIPAASTHAINHAVQSVLHHIAGVWRISVRRSFERGLWRIELSGATGRHVWMIVSRCEDLPELIAAKLRSFIETATARFSPGGPPACTKRPAKSRSRSL